MARIFGLFSAKAPEDSNLQRDSKFDSETADFPALRGSNRQIFRVESKFRNPVFVVSARTSGLSSRRGLLGWTKTGGDETNTKCDFTAALLPAMPPAFAHFKGSGALRGGGL